MPVYKLTYFDVRFRPEVPRLLFHAAGVPFEDNRVDLAEIDELRANGKLPLNQVPTMEIDGRVMVQSRAIMRYVAREVGMYGSNNLESTDIDEVTETIDELIEYARPWWYQEQDPVKKEEARKDYLEVKGPRFLSWLEKKQEKSTSGFVVGSSMTVADLAIFNIIDILNDTMPEVIVPFPKLLALKDKVAANERIANYLKTRPKNEF